MLLLALVPPQPAMAESTNSTAAQVATLRKARLKIWTGITLLTAGGLLLPITATSRQDLPESAVMGSMVLMGAGSGLVYWGVQQRRRAVHPSTVRPGKLMAGQAAHRERAARLKHEGRTARPSDGQALRCVASDEPASRRTLSPYTACEPEKRRHA
jgi:hypothetical protein